MQQGAKRDTCSKSAKAGSRWFFGKERQFKDEEGHFCADQLTGVVHLDKEEADQLYQMIRDFLNEHEGKKKETFPYVYSLVAYRE